MGRLAHFLQAWAFGKAKVLSPRDQPEIVNPAWKRGNDDKGIKIVGKRVRVYELIARGFGALDKGEGVLVGAFISILMGVLLILGVTLGVV